jgi:hypothetical protein
LRRPATIATAGRLSTPGIRNSPIGLEGLSWSLVFFVNNITDERAVLFDNSFEFDQFFGKGRQTVNRPREYGIRYIKRFGGG